MPPAPTDQPSYDDHTHDAVWSAYSRLHRDFEVTEDRVNDLYRFLVIDMKVDTLSKAERESFPIMMAAYHTGRVHEAILARRFQVFLAFMAVIGPVGVFLLQLLLR